MFVFCLLTILSASRARIVAAASTPLRSQRLRRGAPARGERNSAPTARPRRSATAAQRGSWPSRCAAPLRGTRSATSPHMAMPARTRGHTIRRVPRRTPPERRSAASSTYLTRSGAPRRCWAGAREAAAGHLHRRLRRHMHLLRVALRSLSARRAERNRAENAATLKQTPGRTQRRQRASVGAVKLH